MINFVPVEIQEGCELICTEHSLLISSMRLETSWDSHRAKAWLHMQKFTEIFDGWHAAIYVSDFSGAYRAMEAADLIFTEHGFFDANIDGLRDAQKFHQFRFQVNPLQCTCLAQV